MSLGVDHFLDMTRSGTNVIGNSIATAVVSKREGQLRGENEMNPALEHAIEPDSPHEGISAGERAG